MKYRFMKTFKFVHRKKVFLQLNLIIYPKVKPLSNTGLEKFVEVFIVKNQTISF